MVLHPAGLVAEAQANVLINSTLLMLLIIVPVLALTAAFAWHYRAGNKRARYSPDWDHSTQLELVIWGGPLLIVISLGALTWMGTHLLDPYRPLGPAKNSPTASEVSNALEIDAVALDWKWLFIYPQYHIASLNQLTVPAGQPLRFRLTASSVMNSFSIPAMAGQIYAMPGMESTLYGVFGQTGTYRGMSANYSGAGFSGMHFAVAAIDPSAFGAWVATTRASDTRLDPETYLQVAEPSENVPPRLFGGVSQGLFEEIVNLCVQPGKMCQNEMAAIDARGGLGLAAVNNVLPLAYDKYGRRETVFGPVPTELLRLCEIPPPPAPLLAPPRRSSQDLAPLLGAGLTLPAGGQSLF